MKPSIVKCPKWWWSLVVIDCWWMVIVFLIHKPLALSLRHRYKEGWLESCCAPSFDWTYIWYSSTNLRNHIRQPMSSPPVPKYVFYERVRLYLNWIGCSRNHQCSSIQYCPKVKMAHSTVVHTARHSVHCCLYPKRVAWRSAYPLVNQSNFQVLP